MKFGRFFSLGLVIAGVLLLIGAAPARAVTNQELEDFIFSYLEAAEEPTPDLEIQHYADRVRYFNKGEVDKNYIEEDQRNYYRRWPQRNFWLLNGPKILRGGRDWAEFSVVIRYELRGRDRSRGEVENTIRVEREGRYLVIVGISEQKLPPREAPRGRDLAVKREDDEPRLSPPPQTRTDTRPKTKTTTKVKSEKKAPNTTTANTSTADGAKATPVPGQLGYVYLPGAAKTRDNMLDVRGYKSGDLMKDPRTGQMFTVP